MAVRREPSGKWRAVVKNRGRYVAGKSFRTRREALDWERQQKAVMAGGVDLAAGRTPVDELLDGWVTHRRATVAHKTVKADMALLAWIPLSIRRTGVAQVSQGMVTDALAELARSGKAKSSITRFRATLRAFFSWCESVGYIASNPVTGVRVPSSARGPEEMRPYSQEEFDARLEVWRSLDADAAALVQFLAATGLRWSEARALRPGDVQRVPYPAVLVARAEPENSPVKSTKSGKSRRVPLTEDVAEWVFSRLDCEYIAPVRWVTSLKRRLDWSTTSGGRSIHDLRHTAITSWLSDGLDVATVRAWAGHSDLTTTSRYTHWLGGDADRVALDRLNAARARHGHTSNEGRGAL